MTERSHLAIGEVLSLLRDEFPDVTISKIRFLESQGLVDPERTPSGYRKFYDHDVDRLRWILLQQKEHFLPLKVIKDRLEESNELGDEARGTDPSPLSEHQPSSSPTPPLDPPPTAASVAASAGTDRGLAAGPSARPEGDPEGDEVPSENRAIPAADISDTTAEIMASHPRAPTVAVPADLPPPPAATPPVATPPAATPPVSAGEAPLPDTLTLDELAAAADMDRAGIEELEQFGLLSPAGVVGGTAYFDFAALEVAKTAAAFARHGVEARHLRAWRNGAEREAGMFEQIVMPLLRQRNPQARRQAEDTLAELSGLGGDLRAALVRQALRNIR